MTIEADIIAWALDRPGWQQDVLVDLADGGGSDAKDVNDLVDRLIEDTARSPNDEAKRIQLKSATADPVSLVAISNLQCVNALLEGQRLAFAETGMTVVYGDNGSGKSGYAGLVKSLVGARHRAEILPNVFRAGKGSPAGVLDCVIGGEPTRVAFPGQRPPQLLPVSFYDEACGDEYLAKESTISYRPSALTLLDGLVRVCDDVRAEVGTRIKAVESEALELGIPAATRAGAVLASLGATTTIEEIDSRLAPPAGTVERLSVVRQEEARLTISDPEKEQARLQAIAQQVRTLSGHFDLVLSALAEVRTEERRRLRAAAQSARAAAALAAARSFDDEPLTGIGSAIWRALWDAARAYSISQAYGDHEFPVTGEGAVCVLCQQPLRDDAASRLERFEHHMADTTERDALATEQSYARSLGELRTLAVVTPASSAAITALGHHDAELAAEATAGVTLAEEHREAVLRHLVDDTPAPAPMPTTTIVGRLSALAEGFAARAEATDVAAFHTSLEVLRTEKRELEAAVRLSESREEIRTEVERRRRLAELRSARSAADTNAITQKASTLTRQYVTEQIRDQFTRETERLNLQRVTLQDLGGQKGRLNHRPGLLGATEGAGSTPCSARASRPPSVWPGSSPRRCSTT